MKSFRDYRYSKGWIVLLATVVGLGFGGYTFINHAITTHVYVTNCGMQDYKPSTIIKYCADAGVGVGAIEWSSWSAEGASGEGKYQINDCVPNCAAGKQHYADVTVVLSKTKSIHGKQTLTFITITTKDKKNLPLSQSPTDAWPMELAG
jgi:hypothetical protein